MLIHEWQLGPKMNQALQKQQPADFRLWRAMLSTAVEEQAAFVLRQQQLVTPEHSLRQSLGLREQRPFSWQDGDLECCQLCSDALHQGFTQSRLQQQLSPLPWVLKNDPKKLDVRVADNLDLHSRRRLYQEGIEPIETDATALYEVLQQLDIHAAA
ncbi:VC2046/SO_2500 family protein [Alkalimonas sp.]|uniref:VC2046/SO_2500 family protein n=1 Tax=Alkalimonas sp. TaxID=1872453 RepID=UPI00263B4813|nr:VC2046/SO_2500 family protein [Alkalimonas sp.]MCC5824760.1 hypothetical protein [Alkalimonas sp.]